MFTTKPEKENVKAQAQRPNRKLSSFNNYYGFKINNTKIMISEKRLPLFLLRSDKPFINKH